MPDGAEHWGMSYRRVNIILALTMILSIVLIIGAAVELNGLLQFTDWTTTSAPAASDSVVIP